MQTFNLSNVTPSAAAAKLADLSSKPAAYASAIVDKGREFTEAVCAAINARTEDKPEERRALYKVLHQAAQRAGAAFVIVSRKHSGLNVADAPAKGSATEAGGDAPAAPKPGTSAEKIADLSPPSGRIGKRAQAACRACRRTDHGTRRAARQAQG